MFAALQLCQCFVVDSREHQPGLSVRLGVNLGPVKLMRDINGALNAIGDGINAGQRIMSFSAANQILVSQSFFEVVSRLSDDYKTLFQLKGVEADKHVREHTVYHLHQPRLEGQGKAPAQPPDFGGGVVPVHVASQSRSGSWRAVAGGAVAALVAVGAWHFYGSSGTATPSPKSVVPVVQNQTSGPEQAAAPAKVLEPALPARAVSLPNTSAAAARPADTQNAPVSRMPDRPESSFPPPASAASARPDPAKLLEDGKSWLAFHNAEAARESFGKAADAGNAQAMVLLGTLYAQGVGGPKSDSDAVRMFRRAAELGYARGMYNLGLMCEADRGVPAGSGVDAAVGWYSKAADRGDGDAAYRLGLMYEQGRGVPKDLTEARRLYAKAGTRDAAARLATLPNQ
jgi:TPR repeat protein